MQKHKLNGKPNTRIVDGKNIGQGLPKTLAPRPHDGTPLSGQRLNLHVERLCRAVAKANGLKDGPELRQDVWAAVAGSREGYPAVKHGARAARMAPALGLKPRHLSPLEQRARAAANIERRARVAPSLEVIGKIKAHGALFLAKMLGCYATDFEVMPGFSNLSTYGQGMVNAVFHYRQGVRFVVEAWVNERPLATATDPGFTMKAYVIVWHPERRARGLAQVTSLGDLGRALLEPGKYANHFDRGSGAAHWHPAPAMANERLADRLLAVVSEAAYTPDPEDQED